MSDTKGLRLTRPGASLSYHTVLTEDGPIPGVFHPEIPTPVGDDQLVSLEQARKYDKAKDIPLELVDISTRKANQAEKAIAEELNTEAPSGAGGSS